MPDSVIFLASASSRAQSIVLSIPGAALVVELTDLCLREAPGLLPYLVLLAHDCAGQPYQRCRVFRQEDLSKKSIGI